MIDWDQLAENLPKVVDELGDGFLKMIKELQTQGVSSDDCLPAASMEYHAVDGEKFKASLTIDPIDPTITFTPAAREEIARIRDCRVMCDLSVPAMACPCRAALERIVVALNENPERLRDMP